METKVVRDHALKATSLEEEAPPSQMEFMVDSGKVLQTLMLIEDSKVNKAAASNLKGISILSSKEVTSNPLLSRQSMSQLLNKLAKATFIFSSNHKLK